MSELQTYFETEFIRITGHHPYPWQSELFRHITVNRWPDTLDLPTGAGKTSLLPIWWIAWNASKSNEGFTVPRRLAWVVNRRVVVDQVTTEAVHLRDKIGDDSPLAISTLRGQFADNEEWWRDPTRPAIVVGTVDMIGSRLLFRGYRAGPYHRPIHAGLLGVDCLIVNDESHLTPAFARLLTTIHSMQPAGKLPEKSFRVMKLSATPESSGNQNRFDHNPDEDAERSEHFRDIFTAPKKLTIHQTDSKGAESTLRKLATEPPVPRTIVYIEEPQRALDFAERLTQEGRPVALLTGTMRGWERDQLTTARTTNASAAIFQRFQSKQSGVDPVWLVATSAAEVGVDLSCDRLITTLVEADRMLQRFGRLNRFAEAASAEAHVVVVNPIKSDRLQAALEYLTQLNGDISCQSVWNKKPESAATTEVPRFARLEPWRIESWAQTSYRDRLMTPVAAWLHGKEDPTAPEAELAWREDVGILNQWEIDEDEISAVLEAYPVRVHERVREPASRIKKKLEELAALTAQAGLDPGHVPVLRVAVDLSVERTSLAGVADATDLANNLILLPADCGQLRHGMFQPALSGGDTSHDVADLYPLIPGKPFPCRLLHDGSGWRRLGPPPQTDSDASQQDYPEDTTKDALAAWADLHELRLRRVVRHSQQDWLIAYFGAAPQKRKAVRVCLKDHQPAVAQRAQGFASELLPDEMAAYFEQAGQFHDEGKKNEVWQRAMGGSLTEPLAKTPAPANLRILDGYRHEFGSLLDATSFSDPLPLHLIASHHAAARPCFESRQHDRYRIRDSELAAAQVPSRFAVLQERYGPWGLAYLEAIFKSADAAVSSEEGGEISA